MLCIATNMSWVRTAWSELHHPNLIVKAPPTLLGGVKFLPSYLKPHKFLTFLLYHASLAHPENCRSRLAAFLQFWGGGEDHVPPWAFAVVKKAQTVDNKWHLFTSADCRGLWHMSSLGVAVAAIYCPHYSKLALFEGQQISAAWILAIAEGNKLFPNFARKGSFIIQKFEYVHIRVLY